MELGTNLRNWGREAHADSLLACARLAEEGGLHAIWVNDHLAITPRVADATEGGDFLEPMGTLAFLAGATERIGLGVGVLVAPYRPPVLLAKDVATVQTLSRGRLRLGVGVGWLPEEFQAVGVDPKQRGRILDERLAFLTETFAGERVTVNGADVVLRPVPARPRIYVGGAPGASRPEHAFRRALQYGDGWIPAGLSPTELEAPAKELRRRFAEAGRETPEIVAMKTLPLEDPPEAIEMAQAFAAAGATHLVHTGPYAGPQGFAARIDALATHLLPALVL